MGQGGKAMKKTTQNQIVRFKNELKIREYSEKTRKRYADDVARYFSWSGGEMSRDSVAEYKEALEKTHSRRSVNTIISSLNSYFKYIGREDLKLTHLKVQRRVFMSEERELTKAEYDRLLTAAKSKKNERLYLLMQTICSTGIRVSELRFITVEAVKDEHADVTNKGKERLIYLPRDLCKMLKKYCHEQKISSGPVFVTRNGNPLDRSNIWSDMKKLCAAANVSEKKVFPHNLRHLFARTYYSIQKDIVRLADILGHSSINTTRIYTMETGEVHKRQIQRLGLLRC